MKAAVDLHIHTALSPCSDNDMTPNNIVNMAWVKGLDIIAITDHNSVGNFEAVSKCALQRGILAVPGMEIETKEEVHLVCLFPGIDQAVKMQNMVYSALPKLKNREDIFGQQLVMDEEDNILKHLEYLLLTACALSVEDVFHNVNGLGGAVIPAHIDREAYSIVSNLGFVPDHLNFTFLEVSKNCDTETYRHNNPLIARYQLIKSSDAHALGDIFERQNFLEIEALSVASLMETLRSSKNLF